MSVRICHYCGAAARTKDHIVAKYWYNQRRVPQDVAEANKVPACERCNGLKSHFRSDCDCNICEIAWTLMAPYLLPFAKRDIPIIALLEMIRGAGDEGEGA
jgi:hypothetical protein